MIVIVAGLPGSGKSYFAEQLASRIGADYINSDLVRKTLGALGSYTLNDKLVIYNKMVKLAEESLKKQKAVIIDATFYLQSMRNMFAELARKQASVMHLIMVYADESLIKQRLSVPRKDSEADFEVYNQIKEQFEKLTFPHLELESTNDNIETMLHRAASYIDSKWHDSVINS